MCHSILVVCGLRGNTGKQLVERHEIFEGYIIILRGQYFLYTARERRGGLLDKKSMAARPFQQIYNGLRRVSGEHEDGLWLVSETNISKARVD